MKFITLLLLLGLLSCIGWFEYTEIAFFLSFLTWVAVFSLIAALITRSTGTKLVAIHFAAVLSVLALYEGWLLVSYDSAAQGNPPSRSHYSGSYLQGYFLRHGEVASILGYGPKPNFVATSAKVTDNGEVVYDVTYTINERGLRIAPEYIPSARCALFFGGSYTFGEGVEDSEAYPYQVGAQSSGRIQTYNFGFHGYGPHQMLAALESGFVDDAISCKPNYLVYLMLPRGHIERVLGLTSWDQNGPRYVVDETGRAKRVGRFSDPGVTKPIEPGWQKYLYENWLTFRDIVGPWSAIDARSIGLYLAIIRTARNLAVAKYDDSEFHIILWDVGARRELA